MFELHAWCCASSGPSRDEGADPGLVQWIQDEITGRNLNEWATAASLNGEPYFIVHCLRNHESDTLGRVIGLLGRLGRRAVGSYGIVYSLDDEGPVPDRFRVFVMTRGALVEHGDPFLSPIVPTLEDPASKS